MGTLPTTGKRCRSKANNLAPAQRSGQKVPRTRKYLQHPSAHMNRQNRLKSVEADLKAPSKWDHAEHQTVTGIPYVAPPTKLTAPVHIDIGGTTYTSTLGQLTKYGQSKLAKLFNGTTPIMLDQMKHYYFIDRDGKAFRHILNFLRYDELILPSNYKEVNILRQEAEYYELYPLVEKIDQCYKT